MRAPSLIALALAAASFCAQAQTYTRHPDANPYWNGCVVSRQIDTTGATVAVDRVCSAPNVDFQAFEPYQMGQRRTQAGSFGPTSLAQATLRYVGFVSDFSVGDGRKARLWINESGAAESSSSFYYDLTIRPDSEVFVQMPSGYTVGLRMDYSSVPTSFDAALKMPTSIR